MSDELVRERRGAVLVVRLNRPEARNSLNGVLLRAIGAAIVDAEADPEIRALVITGTGDRAFCAVAVDFAERIAANGPLGVAATKELVRLGVTDHSAARTRLVELHESVFNSADAKEGALAFVEKRAPVWQGR